MVEGIDLLKTGKADVQRGSTSENRKYIIKSFDPALFSDDELFGKERGIILPTNKICEFRESNFPLKWLESPEFRDIAKTKKEGVGMLSLNYSSEKYALDEIFESPDQNHPLHAILFRLKVMRYPQKEPILVPSYVFGTRRSYIEDRSTASGVEVDKEMGYPSGDIDKNVAIYLSAILAKPNGRFGGFDESSHAINYFLEVSNKYGLDLDYKSLNQILYLGFKNLVLLNNVEYLLKIGWLKKDELEEFFRTAAYWTAFTSIASLKTEGVIAGIPFQYGSLDEKGYPHPLSFPSSMDALLEYAIEIPEILPEGTSYNRLTFKTDVERLFKYGQEVVDYGFRKMIISPEDHNQITKYFVSVRPLFDKINNYFYRHSRELNKQKALEMRASVYKSYRQILSEILEAGGRAPRKPSLIRVLDSIKKRE